MKTANTADKRNVTRHSGRCITVLHPLCLVALYLGYFAKNTFRNGITLNRNKLYRFFLGLHFFHRISQCTFKWQEIANGKCYTHAIYLAKIVVAFFLLFHTMTRIMQTMEENRAPCIPWIASNVKTKRFEWMRSERAIPNDGANESELNGKQNGKTIERLRPVCKTLNVQILIKWGLTVYNISTMLQGNDRKNDILKCATACVNTMHQAKCMFC